MSDQDFIPDGQFVPDSAQGPSPASVPAQGQSVAQSPDFVPDDQFQSDQDKYGTPGQQAVTVGEGLGKGFLGPIATGAESVLTQMGVPGLTPQDQAGRAAANPVESIGSQIAGFGAGALTGTGEAGLIDAAAEGAAHAVAPGAAAVLDAGKAFQAAKESGQGIEQAQAAYDTAVGAQSAWSRVAQGAISGVTANALYQAGDETSQFINDPGQSVPAAISNIGMAALFGAGVGGTLGAAGAMWNKVAAGKIGQTIEEFKDGIKQQVEHPDAAAEMTSELEQRYAQMKDASIGAKSLNLQEISGLTKDVSPENVTAHIDDTRALIEKAPQALKQNQLFQDAVNEWESGIRGAPPEEVVPPSSLEEANTSGVNPYESAAAPVADTAQVFRATDLLKRKIQEIANYDNFATSISDKPLINGAKSIARGLRLSLENENTWGAAGQRQAEVNEAIHNYIPKLQDFEKKFTSPSADSAYRRVIDPGKINTFLNQLGKPNAELKQEMLQKWMDASDEMESEINKTHASLGLESPFPKIPMNMTRLSLKEVTPGMKIASALTKNIPRAAGKVLGAGVGGLAGMSVGHPEIGAIAGEMALGPFFGEMLPSLVKPILKNAVSPEGLKDAVAFGAAAQRGKVLMTRAVKALFNPGIPLPAAVFASTFDTDKLDKMVKETQVNPALYESVGNHLGDYMPDHAIAMKAAAARVATHLNSIRPNAVKAAPLDSDRKPSSLQSDEYNRAVQIAEQPLSVVGFMHGGRLTAQDVNNLDAMHPDYSNALRQSVQEHMINHLSKGSEIPYSQRLGLSALMKQPMDSSFFPQHIAGNQMALAGAAQENADKVNPTPKTSVVSLRNMKRADRVSLSPQDDND